MKAPIMIVGIICHRHKYIMKNGELKSMAVWICNETKWCVCVMNLLPYTHGYPLVRLKKGKFAMGSMFKFFCVGF